MKNTFVVIPNYNGREEIGACLDSLRNQVEPGNVIIIDNGSSDGSIHMIEEKYSQFVLIKHKKNLGFAGGVNSGIRYAIELGAKYIALINNDAVAGKDWLKEIVNTIDKNPKAGIVTSKIRSADKKRFDSTGDTYTTWGLPFPRGRDEPVSNKYDEDRYVFGASGGASIYRVKMLKEIGVFDKDFFAYYEDVDISFRAQLAGWKVMYEPNAVVYHAIGATSGKIKDFAAYQTMKNLPWLVWKNVPWRLMPTVLPRFTLAYLLFFLSALRRGQFWAAIKGVSISLILLPKKLIQRHLIKRKRSVSEDYIRSILTYDLPPNAKRLRSLRSKWWKLTRRSA